MLNKRWFVVLIVMGLLVGCKQKAKPTDAPSGTPVETPGVITTPSTGPVTTGDVDVVVVTADRITTLDPYLMRDFSPEENVAAHIWDTLVGIDDDLGLEPRLAESWHLINDYVWEFELRQGVQFHNGEPWNAEAAQFSLTRAATLTDALETFATDVSLESVEVVDEYTIRIRTQEPAVNLPYELATVEMLPREYYQATAEDELSQQPIGSGPYRFVTWDSEGTVTLEAVPDYWRGSPLVQSIQFATALQAEQRVARLDSGDATLIADVPPDWMDEVEESAVARLVLVEGTQRMLVGIHIQENTPLADRRVRQALNYAVDVEAIVSELLGGYGQRYGSWVNPPNDNPDLTAWPYDPEKARELLVQAGYSDGFSTEMHLPVDRYQRGQEVAEAIADDLGQVGVQVEIKAVPWSEYVRELLNPDLTPPLFLLRINSRANGLEDTENLAYSFPFNPTQWFDTEFEDLLDEARQTYNATRQVELLKSAQTVAYDAAPWIWLWRPFLSYGVSQELDWWQPRADGLIYLYTPTPGTTTE
jgi:peptide/nickel transport system substrate-binding protein